MRKLSLTSIHQLLAGLLMLGFLSASPRPAQATENALTPETQAAMDRGLAAAKQQEWAMAKRYFHEALDSLGYSPYSPQVLFNLALAYDRGGGAELMAIAYYRAYLAIAPGADNTRQVHQRIVELDVAAEANVLKLVEKIKGLARELSTWIWCRIIKAQVLVGDMDGARQTLSQSGYDRCVIDKMIWAQLARKDIDGAKNALKLYVEKSEKYDGSKTYIYFAEWQVKACERGEVDFKAALETLTEAERQASQIDDTAKRDYIFGEIKKLRLRLEKAKEIKSPRSNEKEYSAEEESRDWSYWAESNRDKARNREFGGRGIPQPTLNLPGFIDKVINAKWPVEPGIGELPRGAQPSKEYLEKLRLSKVIDYLNDYGAESLAEALVELRQKEIEWKKQRPKSAQ